MRTAKPRPRTATNNGVRFAPLEKRLHTGIALHTPADVHYGLAETIRDKRAGVLDAAYAAHPERFVRQPPRPPKLPTTVWINPPDQTQEQAQ